MALPNPINKVRGLPSVVALGGPNGAGKSTAAAALLRGALAVNQFVNADVIAKGLAGFAPETVAARAGRIMLGRLKSLAADRENFAFETTLAGRSFAPWLRSLVEIGYQFHLVFLWIPSADMAVARVANRVKMGGHDVPEETIRRRFAAGLRNFHCLYRPISTSWRVYDNSEDRGPRLIALGTGSDAERVADPRAWRLIEAEANL